MFTLHSLSMPIRAALTAAVLGASPALAAGQTLINDGQQYPVAYSSANVAQDFTIPSSNPPGAIRVTVRGGKGGGAEASLCESSGGKPASATATFIVGTGAGQLEPGGSLRYVVGERGESSSGSFNQSGGGAGGSAALYRGPSDTQWTLLVVAGGGGGANQDWEFVCINSHNGGDAQVGESGGAGGGSTPGGSDGDGGEGVLSNGSGGGGGSLGNGFGNLDLQGWTGYPAGGAGGTSQGNGGWGYGGGGAGGHVGGGGGGGGYSGGGGGNLDQAGGGGGSYVHSAWAIQEVLAISSGSGHGTASYQCIGALGAPDCSIATAIGDGTLSSSTINYPLVTVTDCIPGPAHLAWYSYTNNGVLPLDITATTTQSSFGKTALAVMSACGQSPPDTCGQSVPGSSHQTLTWSLPAGQTSFLRVNSNSTTNPFNGQDYVLEVSSTPSTVTNNTCSTALTIDVGTWIASMSGATSGPSVACDFTTGRDVWFRLENSGLQGICFEVTATSLGSAELAIEASESCGGTILGCTPTSSVSNLTFAVPAQGSALFRVASGPSGGKVPFVLDIYQSTHFATWTDLGNGLAGTAGLPLLTGQGADCGGIITTIRVDNGAPQAFGFFFLGLSEVFAPIKGGVLVPTPDNIVPVVLDVDGRLLWSFPWPSDLPPGIILTMQCWFADAAGPKGYSATNGLRLKP